MYGCESCTIKKAEHESIDAFDLWCWKRLLRVPWTARRSNQSILGLHPGDQSWMFIGRTDVEAKTQILWPPHAKSWLTWKILMPAKIEERRRAWQRMRWLDGITDSMDMSFGLLPSMGLQRVGHAKRLNSTVIEMFEDAQKKISEKLL